MSLVTNNYKIEDPNLLKQKYLIIEETVNGKGDISCALKVATLIHKLGIPKENIYIVTEDFHNIELFNSRFKFPWILPSGADKVEGVVLQIVAPATSHPQVFKQLTVPIPILALYEYGYTEKAQEKFPYFDGWVFTKSFGLGKEDIGILIDPELYEASQNKELKDPIKRIEKLKEYPKLQKAILGEGEFSERAKDFVETSRLYTGYMNAESSLESFVLAIASLNKDNKSKLVFFFPGGDYSTLFDKEKLQKKLQSQGIVSFSFKIFDRETGKVTEKRKLVWAQSGKELIIFRGTLSPSEISSLLIASEKESCNTGDQSLSEGISINKTFIYEKLDHKSKLAQDLMQRYVETTKSFKLPVYSERELKSDNGQSIADFFKTHQKDNYKSISEANQTIANEYNSVKEIKKQIEHICSQKHSAVPYEILVGKGEDKVKNLDFDRWYLIDLDQVVALRISVDTGVSQCTGYEDSLIEGSNIGSGLYLMKRVKRKP